MMRFFFALGWYLTIAWLHITDTRVWRFLAPYIVVAAISGGIGICLHLTFIR